MMNIYLIGVLVSVLIYIIIGIFVGRKIKNVEDYYVSGRNATTLFITGTIFASMLSSNGFMGDTGFAYGGNITTLILLNTICGMGYIIGGLFFGRYIRRSQVNTMPSYFGNRFNSKRIRKFAGLVTVFSLSAYLLSVFQGTSQLMEAMTSLDKEYCLLLAWFCVVVFTLYSGSKGVIITDTIMFMLFLTATFIAGLYIFDAAGGVSNLLVNLVNNPNTPEGLLAYHGNESNGTLFYGFMMGIVWLVTVAVSPWQAGRNLMVKNEHVIFRSGTMANLIMIFFLTYLYIMAISVIQLNPNMEQEEQVIIWTAFEVMPQFVGVLLLAGIMSAGLSSASTFLSVVSFSMTDDVLEKKFKSDKEKINFTRMIVFVISTIALIIAYLDVSSMRIIAWFASTVIAATWGYLAFASVWSKKITERGAYLSMIGGFLGYLITKALKELAGVPFENLFDPFFLGVAFSIVLGILGSKGQTRSQQEIDFLKHIHTIPQSEIVAKEYKRDYVYGWTLIIVGVLTAIFLIKYWALPYNEAIGNALM